MPFHDAIVPDNPPPGNGFLMKWKCATLLVIAMSGPMAHAQEVARDFPASVTLDVQPDGQVVHVHWLGDFPAALAKSANNVMMRWHFKPVIRHGQRVGARTYARIHVQIIKQGTDSYGMRVRYHSNGPHIRPTAAPYYPLLETGNGQAEMLMEAVVQPDGTLADVRIVEAYFKGIRTRLFRKSAIAAVERWRADPEFVDGRPIATRIQIPMSFLHKSNDWSLPKLKLLHRTDVARDSSPAPVGEAIAMDSPLELELPSGS